jgi:hypothetical protein
MNFGIIFVVLIINIFYVFWIVSLEISNRDLIESQSIVKQSAIKQELGCLPYYNSTMDCKFDLSNIEKWEKVPPICLLFSNNCKNLNHFLGVSHQSFFSFADFLLLDFTLTKHQKYRNIVEYPTGKGLNSLYLSMISKTRSGSFSTFDKRDRRSKEVRSGWIQPYQQHLIINSNSRRLFVEAIAKESSVLVLYSPSCKFIQKFAPHLKRSSLILMYLPPVNRDFGCIRNYLMDDYYEMYGSVSRHFASNLIVNIKKR